jgi:hypothetical protein
VLSLVFVVASLGVVGAGSSTSNRAASKPVQIAASGRGVAPMKGIVDLAKLPTVKAGAQPTIQAAPQQRLDPLTPAQRTAYEAGLKHATNLPSASAGAPLPQAKMSPNFIGGSKIPLLTKNVDGLSSVEAGAPFVVASPAIATDLSYVMEGVSESFAIYRASDGSRAFGPYLESSFFAPVFHSSDLYGNTLMDYDVMRDRWIVVAMEGSSIPGTPYYLDIAVSTSTAPNQPAPGGQYHEYQIPMDLRGAGSNCYGVRLGVEYYSLTITCSFNIGNDIGGNNTIVIDKAPLLTGASASYTLYQDVMLDNGHVAFAISPAIEDGVQDAEYLVASEAGWGGPFTKITLCALTNLRNIATTAPTYTCGVVDLGVSYSDPVAPRQPGGTLSMYAGAFGTNEMYFKAGRLYFALTTAITGPRDGILWAELQPQLTTQAAHNPQWINGADYVQTGMFYFSDPNTDVYVPTVMGTDENDMSLVFNYSGNATSGLYPSIGFTGRKVSDAPGTMGQGGASATAASGLNNGGNWGGYAGCAIPLNSVTRGSVWCAYEYAVSNAWKTRLMALRLE